MSIKKQRKDQTFNEYFEENSLQIFLEQDHIKRRTSNRLLFNLFRAYPYATRLYLHNEITEDAKEHWEQEDKATQDLAYEICEDIKKLKGTRGVRSIEEYYSLSTKLQWYLLSDDDRKFIHNSWL